jgi:hypothetical protein
MSAKYQPLQDYLKSLPVSRTHITLSFEDIEKLTGHKLPSSAYQHRAWWSNQADLSNRPQAKAWRNAGFKVQSVKCGNKDGLVSFSREGKFSINASSVPESHAHGLTRSELPVAAKRTEADRASGKEIVLVSCVKSKRSYPCKAGDMYTSPLFQKMMAYARSLNPQRIFILSAKYGLLNPDDVIDPYERTLKVMRAEERQAWALDVLSKLGGACNLESDQFVFLAGLPYRENLVSHLKHYEVPMEGLAFGKQLKWLEAQLR